VKLRDLTIRKGEFADCICSVLQLKSGVVLCVQSYMAIGQNSIQKKTHVVNSISPLPTLPVGGTIKKKGVYITLWLFNIAMENGPFIDDFPIKTSIYKGFSMAMLNNQMVLCFHSI